MSDIAIKIQDLGKLYRLGEVGTGTLSHDLNRWWHRVRGKEDPYQKIGQSNDRTRKAESDYVWALRDINLEVKKGEVLGIIGRNGAGKSTLLKILSQVTSPTTGRVEVFGRIASLLEVGTGFHPELTGRENIFLNGAILGMRRNEIQKKFDEIVDFAGVEAYIDTPVKRYSSGMYVRLAFAVAAFLEPEILVVDEVLAVGDAEFQKKCLGRIKDVSVNEGRTVLFVSHNMAAIRTLCEKAIVLTDGSKSFEGDSESAIAKYLQLGVGNSIKSKAFEVLEVSGFGQIKSIGVSNRGKTSQEFVVESEPIEIHVDTDVNAMHPSRYHITFHLHGEGGEALFSFSSSQGQIKLNQGSNSVRCEIPKHFLQPGFYSLRLFIVEDRRRSIFNQSDVLVFQVIEGERELGVYMGREPGSIRPQFEWRIESL